MLHVFKITDPFMVMYTFP